MNKIIHDFIKEIDSRNSHEPEFMQAVREVSEDLIPYIVSQDIYHGKNIDNFKDVYKLLKSFGISKRISTPKELASSIIFKKNKYTGIKIKNMGAKILKKTIKELDYFISDDFKKT